MGIVLALTQPKEKEYLLQNQVNIGITLEEFKSATNSDIGFGDDYSIPNLSKIYDSVSSDILDYCIDFEHKEDFVSGEIYVVVNKYFNFQENHFGEIVKTKFDGYNIEYSMQHSMFARLFNY